jgi:NAD(P)-dependent dehydrogenase (short-subunit alcohol dehydrogenase family)
MQSLNNRVAVVTGAASGIGRATSVALVRKGCHVALADINEAELAETARLAQVDDRKITTHRVDVADKQQMQDFASDVVRQHGQVHVLVNNAGVAATSTFEHQRLEDFEWLFGINFWGVVFGCKYFLPHLREVDEAQIVNISSVFGFVGVPLNSSYCASKFAVRGFSESLRAELTGTHIGVTTVHPGGVATNIVQSARYGDEALGLKDRTVQEFTRMMPPSKAAQRIVRGIERNSPRVLITPEAYAIDAAKRLFPALSGEIVGRTWRSQVARWLRSP